MSYDVTHRLYARRAAADAAAQTDLQDRRLLAFLRQLDDAPFEVTDWEAKFIADVLPRRTLTQGQRDVIEKLVKTYAHRLPPVRSAECGVRSAELPATAPGHCHWLTRGDEGRQTRCNSTDITERTRSGAEYCREHAEVREAWRKRQAAQKRNS